MSGAIINYHQSRWPIMTVEPIDGDFKVVDANKQPIAYVHGRAADNRTTAFGNRL